MIRGWETLRRLAGLAGLFPGVQKITAKKEKKKRQEIFHGPSPTDTEQEVRAISREPPVSPVINWPQSEARRTFLLLIRGREGETGRGGDGRQFVGCKLQRLKDSRGAKGGVYGGK